MIQQHDQFEPWAADLKAGDLVRCLVSNNNRHPRPQQSALSDPKDTFSDGFARGLGYIDREDMEAQAFADPDDWQQRIEQAHAALCERYEADGGADPHAGGLKVLTAALNEWSGAKAGNSEWPEHDDSDGLAGALSFLGVSPEVLEGRGCH